MILIDLSNAKKHCGRKFRFINTLKAASHFIYITVFYFLLARSSSRGRISFNVYIPPICIDLRIAFEDILVLLERSSHSSRDLCIIFISPSIFLLRIKPHRRRTNPISRHQNQVFIMYGIYVRIYFINNECLCVQ